MNIDDRLLKILACPACRADLRWEEPVLVCAGCGLRYPVRDGIPILLVEEAAPARPGQRPPTP